MEAWILYGIKKQAKEKVEELVSKYSSLFGELAYHDMTTKLKVIECVLITVNEVINALNYRIGDRPEFWSSDENEQYTYWQEVQRYLNLM